MVAWMDPAVWAVARSEDGGIGGERGHRPIHVLVELYLQEECRRSADAVRE